MAAALEMSSQSHLKVVNVEAKVGRKGFVKVKGDLPMALHSRKQAFEKPRGSRPKNAINLEAHALELRLRNSYTGTCRQLKQVQSQRFDT